MSRFVPEVLNVLLAEGRYSAEDLAGMAGCSANMIYRVRNEDAELSTSKVQALARRLCEHGDTRLAACFTSPDYVITSRAAAIANGCINDDAAGLLESLGRMVGAYRDGSRAAMDAAITDAQRHLDAARAERDRL